MVEGRKVILTVDSDGNLVDDDGVHIFSGFFNNYLCKEYKESAESAKTTLELVRQDVNVDDILKLKKAGLI